MNFGVFYILVHVLSRGIGAIDEALGDGLYSSEDYVTILDDDSFSHTVYGSTNAWMVEFYNSWCGHCVRFAPTWKQIAEDVKDWWPVMKLAAVDCNSQKALATCKKFGIEEIPTVKVFKPESPPEDLGVDFAKHPMNEDTVEEGIVDFVGALGRKPGWPDLTPLSSLKNIWDTVTLEVKHVLVFFEEDNSYLGRKIILDMCLEKRLVLRRMVKEDISQYGISNLPTLFLIDRGGIFTKLSSSSNHTELVHVIRQLLSGTEDGGKASPLHGEGKHKDATLIRSDTSKDDHHVNVSSSVHMQDLESSVYYSFTHEIAKFQVITDELLPILKNYTAVLALYFPGTAPVRRYLKRVNDWLQAQRAPLSGADWLHNVEDMQSEESYLPTTLRWVGCHGSKPHFRGYPCGLWMLFHSLTVSALTEYSEEASRDPRRVLVAMRGYVTHFFGCTDCSKNFNKGAIYIEQRVHSLDDSVMFLWRSHNKANFHLRGDLTEDPQSPKMQFPSRDRCPDCRLENTKSEDEWDTSAVLGFMRKTYTRRNIVNDGIPFVFIKKSRHMETMNRVGMLRKGRPMYMAQPVNITWSFNSVDLSMCFFFYVVCAAFIMFLCYHFTVMRRMPVSSIYHAIFEKR